MPEETETEIESVFRDESVRRLRGVPPKGISTGGLRTQASRPSGAVYVMPLKSGKVKVGYSADPDRRRVALGAERVAFALEHEDARWVEKVAHRLLCDHGVGNERFTCPETVAIQAVQAAAALYSTGMDA